MTRHSKSYPLPCRLKPNRSAVNDNRASDIRLDQYFTRPNVAEHFYRVFQEHFDPREFLMIEPSAGTGSFFQLFPKGSLGFDVEPKYPSIETADFLSLNITSERPIAMLGNPPFGKNASMAVRFFNHAALQSSVIAFILPRTFRKASVQNRLNRSFHLLREEPAQRNAFLFRDRPYDVPAVFQIWERRRDLRPLRPVETRHPDFEFTTPDEADCVVQRVGARAGRVHHDRGASPNSHYFIRGDVEHVLVQLDFASVTGDVAGNRSLAKSEIVSLYCQWIKDQKRVAGTR